MQPKHRALGVAAGLLAAGLIWGDARAQVALTGLVSAPDEGPMEGVLVSAKREGSHFTTTVVSNDKGQFSFPTGKLEVGKYNLTIRAAGYTHAVVDREPFRSGRLNTVLRRRLPA